MRIAMVVRQFSTSGGLELYAHQLVEGLLRRGLQVTIFCEESNSNLTHENLQVLRFEPAPRGSKKAVRLKHYWQTTAAAVKAAGNFDIVHSQHLPVANANVVTFHNHTAARMKQVGLAWERLLITAKMKLVPAYQLRDQYDRELCKNASHLLFPSRICMQDFEETYSIRNINPQCRMSVAYPGAALDADSVDATEYGAARDPFTFLFVGKGFRKKGLDVLFDACRILKQKGCRFRLLIAGLREKPLDSVRLSALGLKGIVEYKGFCKDMRTIYKQASASILPSRIEPFGMAPWQGALFRLVPILSKVCGAAELIEDGHNGLILQNHLSAQELAAHMKKLVDNPAFADQLAENAAGTAMSLTWDRTCEATIKAYESILTGAKP